MCCAQTWYEASIFSQAVGWTDAVYADLPLVLILREVLGGVCANVPGYGQIVNLKFFRYEGRERKLFGD